ncbi:hypothetical protein JCM8547_005403 [Rhodosporidiobolus lusitaniae]
MSTPVIGFVGFGNMGTPRRCQTSPLKCHVVVTMLIDDKAAREVHGELLKGVEGKGAGKETVFVDCSTLYPDTSVELEKIAQAVPGATYLSAPVFGPPPAAKAAKLIFLLSGSSTHRSLVSPILVPSMGSKIIDCGEDVKKATSFKLCGNAMVLGAMELVAEGLTLAEKTGVGKEEFFEWVKVVFPAAPFTGYGGKMLNNDFSAGFSVRGGLKDAKHVTMLAAEHGVPIPAVDGARQHLSASLANGGGDLDWSSLIAGTRLAAGLAPFSDGPSPATL